MKEKKGDSHPLRKINNLEENMRENLDKEDYLKILKRANQLIKDDILNLVANEAIADMARKEIKNFPKILMKK